MPRAIRDALGRANYEIKTLVAQYPSLALPVARRRGHGVLLESGTELLIEGFPRSGNSFAVAAFTMAQGRPVAVAHHVHAPAHVIAAVRANVPALVVIRDPAEAIPTFAVRHPEDPEISMRQALRGYVRFYAPLVPYRRRFVVGGFPELTSDFGAVIRRVNRRFGTTFREFEHTEENVRACFEAIDRFWQQTGASADALERVVARPSELRNQVKDRLRDGYGARELSSLRTRAQRLYEALVLS
jgi:hypothetical protein